jgi:hypothetical protein
LKRSFLKSGGSPACGFGQHAVTPISEDVPGFQPKLECAASKLARRVIVDRFLCILLIASRLDECKFKTNAAESVQRRISATQNRCNAEKNRRAPQAQLNRDGQDAFLLSA